MANICDNTFLISWDSEEIGDKILNKLEKIFNEKLDGEITYADSLFIEGYFDSKWVFPMDVFEDFFNEFDDNSIYMRCLSTEYGMGYVAMNIYRDKNWKEEQNFEL